MKLILVRHAETVENVAKKVMGNTHGKLTDAGLEQARMVAERLKDEKIDHVYTSDLKRASDTASEIVKFHPNVPFDISTALRERNFGPYTGADKGSFSHDDPALEPLDHLYDRVKQFIDEVYHKHKDGTVLLATHNGVIRTLLTIANEQPPSEICKIKGHSNTGLTFLEITEDQNHTVHLVDCSEHLEE